MYYLISVILKKLIHCIYYSDRKNELNACIKSFEIPTKVVVACLVYLILGILMIKFAAFYECAVLAIERNSNSNTNIYSTKQCCALKKTNKKTTKLPTWFFSTMLQRLPVLKMWWEEGRILDHWKLPFLTTLVNSLTNFRIRSENLPKLGLVHIRKVQS